MTIEEAIKTIETAKAEVEWNYPMDYQIAFDMAIEALENYADCRNELCLKCGRYKESHLGACKDCRWETLDD